MRTKRFAVLLVAALMFSVTGTEAQRLPLTHTGDLYWKTSNLTSLDVSDLNNITIKGVFPSSGRVFPGEGMAFDVHGNLYTGNEGLEIYDSELNRIGYAPIQDSISTRPMTIALRSPQQAFACNPTRPFARLFVFDTSDLRAPTLTNIVTIPFSEHNECRGIAFDATGHLWVTSNALIKLGLDPAGNITTSEVFQVARPPSWQPAFWVAFEPGTERLFWVTINENRMTVADPDNPLAPIGEVTDICDNLLLSPVTLAFSSRGDLFVSCGNVDGATTDLVIFRASILSGLRGTVHSSTLNPIRFASPELVGGGEIAFKPGVIPVMIDIKPGDSENTIKLGTAGVIPVAILSSESFDATTVDPETITLAGASVRMVGKASRFLCSEQDVNEDGRLDMVCQVETAQFLIEPGQSVAVLEAQTLDGRRIRGEDSVRIVAD